MDEALAEANKAVDMAPDDVFTLSSLGYVHAMRDEWDQAVPLYQKAVAVQPNWAWLQLLLAEGLPVHREAIPKRWLRPRPR